MWKLKRTKRGGIQALLGSHRASYVLDILETQTEVRDAGLVPTAENTEDEQVGTEDVPYDAEFDTEQHMEDLDDMPELEEELPPNVTVEQPVERAQPETYSSDVPPDSGPPNLMPPPPLPPRRRSSRNISRKKTISEELSCKFKFIVKNLG